MTIQQGSEEWLEARSGRITASRFADAIAMNKKTGASTEARTKYMRTIVAEILSGRPKHSVSSQSLAWGSESERFAREAYELDSGLVVKEASFIPHYQYDFIGGSPDGLVNDDGIIEIKCPHDEQVHIGTWLNGIPDEHIPQVQGNMMVTGREWCDFISYDVRQGDDYKLYVQRIERDEDYISHYLLPHLLQFWAEVQAMLQKIREKAA